MKRQGGKGIDHPFSQISPLLRCILPVLRAAVLTEENHARILS